MTWATMLSFSVSSPAWRWPPHSPSMSSHNTPVPDPFSDEEIRHGFDGAKTITSTRGREYNCRISGMRLLVWLAPHEQETSSS